MITHQDDQPVSRTLSIAVSGFSLTGLPFFLLAALIFFLTMTLSSLLVQAKEQEVTFDKIEPIFEANCVSCHSGMFARQGYDLSSHEGAVSPRGRVRVVPGNPDSSELVRRVRGQARPSMPLNQLLLSPEDIELIERWVAGGARDAQGRAVTMPAGASVRLHGYLTDRWELDGLPLVVTRGTRIDDSPETGEYVQVRGHLDREGRVVAERIRPR